MPFEHFKHGYIALLSSQAKDYSGDYVVLHMQKGRRLYGFAEEWPVEPNNGYFHIIEAEWLDSEAVPGSIEFNSTLLVPAKEVTIVEFLPARDR